MIAFLYNLKVIHKLLLLLVLPITGVTYLSVFQIVRHYQMYQEMDYSHQYIKSISTLGEVIYNLQKERGLSLGFVGSEGKSFLKEMLIGRYLTDISLANLSRHLSRTDRSIKDNPSLESFLEKLKTLKDHREYISSVKGEYYETYAYFSGLIESLIASYEPLLLSTSDKINPLYQLHHSYFHLTLLIETFGKERALVMNVLNSLQFSPSQYEDWIILLEKQKWITQEFINAAPKPLVQAFHETVSSNTVFNSIVKIREILKEKKFSQLTHLSENWFNDTTKRIDLLINLEENILNEIKASSKKYQTNAWYGLLFWLLFSSLGSLFTLLICLLIIRDITSAINMANSSLQQIGNNLPLSNDHYPYDNEFKKLFAGISTLELKLKEAKKILQNKERMQTLKATIVSLNHEILNPLSIIVGRIEVLKRKLPENDTQFESMEMAADKIHQIIKKISSLEDITFENYTEDSQMLKLD